MGRREAGSRAPLQALYAFSQHAVGEAVRVIVLELPQQRDGHQLGRVLEGPSKEVFFPQDRPPGHRGLSDFTAIGKLCVTVAGALFVHIPYHFVLAFWFCRNSAKRPSMPVRPTPIRKPASRTGSLQTRIGL